jgi:sialate O-acetylesterase
MRILTGLLPGHVLQRLPKGARATLRGESTTAGAIVATITSAKKPLKGWKNQTVGRALDGQFTATLKGLPSGGPYALVLRCGKERCEVAEFYVGDLWLMAGQSNMEGVGNLVDAPKPHPQVRNFSMAHRWEIGRDPLHHLPESPDKVHNGGTQQSAADATKPNAASRKARASASGSRSICIVAPVCRRA